MDKWGHIVQDHKRYYPYKRVDDDDPSQQAREYARQDNRRAIHDRCKKGQCRVDLKDGAVPEAQFGFLLPTA